MFFTFTNFVDIFLIAVKTKAYIFVKQDVDYRAIDCAFFQS